MISTTVCPSSWNSRSLRRTTVWPRWMSGVVGSTPSFTRSGSPFASWRSSWPSGSASTALRVRNGAASPAESVMAPMLNCAARWAPGGALYGAGAPDYALVSPVRKRGTPLPGRPKSMQEPPTSIIQPPPTHGPRFVRGDNGAPPEPPKPPKPKLKKLRLALVVLGLSVLALISTVFGMLMAVASDLPSLDSEAQFRAAQNSVLYARGPECRSLESENCQQIAKVTG